MAVNELVDTFLYLGALIATAWPDGATHLSLASEAEVQENVELRGRTVQHPHAMYSVATQTAVSALLSRFGMRCGSLQSPLHSEQVQQLLWKRYPDLSDLQYSCWRVGPREATCSSCSQCLRIAFAALAIGESPQRMGIDLVTLVGAMRHWEARQNDGPALLPGARVAVELHAQTVRSIVATSVRGFVKALAEPGRLITPRGLVAVARFQRMRRRMRRIATPPQPGYRPSYLEHVDPLLRERIAAIYATSLPAEPAERHEAMRRRGAALAQWIAEPLEAEAAVEGVA